MTKEQFIGKVTYDPSLASIIANQKDGTQQLLLDVRGWGAIQRMFDTGEDAEYFQDQIGKFIADAINEKMNRHPSSALDLIAAEREKQKITSINISITAPGGDVLYSTANNAMFSTITQVLMDFKKDLKNLIAEDPERFKNISL